MIVMMQPTHEGQEGNCEHHPQQEKGALCLA